MKQKYFRKKGNDNWSFCTRDNTLLIKHSDTKIERHVKIKGNASPYNGDWVYWSTRMGEHPKVPASVAKLLKRQKGKCAHCGYYLKDEDVMETDHIIPKSKGGKDSYGNLQILHRHCHDKKTANDSSPGNKSSCNSAKPKPPVEPDTCGSGHLIRNSSVHYGKPKHQCKNCDHQFFANPTKTTVSNEIKQLFDRLLLERISLRGIARVAQVSWSCH